MSNYAKETITIKGTKVDYYKVNNDINGNPRYVIHFLTVNDDYNRALRIIKERLMGSMYRAKWFGGGLVFSSYNLSHDLSRIIKKVN